MSLRHFVSFALVLSVFCPAVAGAQTNTVTLSGVATDDTGGALPGVTVTATNTATGLVRTATTDSAGRYTVLGLPPAAYDVRAELQGFAPVVQRAQQLQVGQEIALNFTLKLGGLTETIEVTAQTSVVQTESNVVQRVVRTAEVDQLPSLSRDFTQLANLSPGVTATGNNVTIGNGPAGGTGFQVDGTSMQSQTTSGAHIPLVQDWIQEFSVLSSQFPAEFGAAQNGVVNAVTRSGSNRVQGRVFGYFQDDAMNSRLWRATTKNPFTQRRTGAQIGGPLVRDKLLYFVGYERNHSLVNVPVSISPIFANEPGLRLSVDGTQAVGTVRQNNVLHSTLIKVDYRQGIAHTLTFRGIISKNDNSANGSSTATNVPLTANRGELDQLRDSAQGAWTWIISSSSLLDSRVEYRRNSFSTGCFAAGNIPWNGMNSLTKLTVPTFVYPSGGPTIGCSGRWGAANERGVWVNEALTMNRGAHMLKVGGLFARPINFVAETQNQGGRYTMPSVALFNPASPSTYPLAYVLNFEPGDAPGWRLGGSQYGLFVQDTWRMGRGLTLNLGLRYDGESKLTTINHEIDNMQAPYNTRLNHLNAVNAIASPRLGFTWAPRESNRLAIRGGFGMFYDTAKNGTFAGWAGQTGNGLLPGGKIMNISANNATLNPYCLGNTRCAAGVPADLQAPLRALMAWAIQNNTFPDLSLTSVTVNGVTTALPGVTVNPIPLSLGHIDENIKIPFTRQETIGVQFDPGGGFNAAVDVKFIQGRDQYVLRNVNRTQGNQIIDPVFQTLNKLGNGGNLDVKQLLVDVGYRSPRGDMMQVAYALGTAFSNSISNFGNQVSGTAATDPFDYSVDYGPTSNQQTHILNVSGNIVLPLGISFAPLVRATSGVRVNPTTNGRPSAAQGCQVFFAQCYPFNTTTGQVLTRNFFVGAPNWTLSARLSKDVRIGSRRLVAMIEGFNLTNQVNYSSYNGNIGGATGLVADLAGIVPNGAEPMRQVQVGLRFDF